MEDEAETEASPTEAGLLSVWLLLTILVGEDEAREKWSDADIKGLCHSLRHSLTDAPWYPSTKVNHFFLCTLGFGS